MDDLVAFLQARLDEDEQVAQAATDGPWRATHRADGTHHVLGGAAVGEWTSSRKVHRDGGYPVDWPEDVVNPAADADHIARHDPARVLREVEAKREMLSHYESATIALANAGASGEVHDLMTGAVNTLRAVLLGFAQIYSDHPDYRPAWRP